MTIPGAGPNDLALPSGAAVGLGLGALQGAVRGAGKMSPDEAASAIRGAPLEGVRDSHAAGMMIAPALARGDTAAAKAALLSSVAHATAHMPDESVPGVAAALTASQKPGDPNAPVAPGPSAYDRALAGLLLLAHPKAWLPEAKDRNMGPQTRRIGDPAPEGQ